MMGPQMGDFSAEKQHILSDMTKKLEALREDRLLTRTEREQVNVTAVCSIFNYSAGIVDWTKSELDNISSRARAGGAVRRSETFIIPIASCLQGTILAPTPARPPRPAAWFTAIRHFG
jgi:hypothetical protein